MHPASFSLESSPTPDAASFEEDLGPDPSRRRYGPGSGRHPGSSVSTALPRRLHVDVGALASTEKIKVFPDVANLAMRPPAMLAKQSASLDVMSDGRFELGLGAGSFTDAIAAMGGPQSYAVRGIFGLRGGN